MSRDPTEALTSISLLHCCGKDRTNHQRHEACRSSRRRHAALWILRDTLGLTGTKFGCGVGVCGACTVLDNDQAVRSCQIPCSAAAGRNFTTIEGLSPNGSHPCQRAWLTEEVAQCGLLSSRHDHDCVRIVTRKIQTRATSRSITSVGLGLPLRNLSANAQTRSVAQRRRLELKIDDHFATQFFETAAFGSAH